MGELIDDVLAAQRDRNQLNQLISNYLPFIKKQISGLQGMRLEYDDMLSLEMLTFFGCVKQYEEGKGNFLSFCGVCIRNRLVDESRRQSRHDRKLVPLFEDGNGEQLCAADMDASIAAYHLAQERSSLAQEIEVFACQLKKFEIDFEDLPRVCPKQVRSRRLCLALAREIIGSPQTRREFMSTRRIAQAELSTRFSISPKTIEKHRKYVVALVVLMDGDYPYIQSFLPAAKEVI